MTETDSAVPGEPLAFALLALKLWPVPQLAWRDLKRCRMQLLELQQQINEAIAAAQPPAEESDDGVAERNTLALCRVFQALPNEAFERLVVDVVYAGIAAGSPSLTRQDFEAMPIAEAEWQFAWLIVRRQSGLFVVSGDGEAAEEGGASGEGGGAA